MILRGALVLGLVGAFGHNRVFAQGPIRLASGDSIAIIARGPIVGADGRGLLVRFYPYSSLNDTLRLQRLALQLWTIVRRDISASGVSWAALQATNQTPGPHVGVWSIENYGFLFERRSDGKWYLSGSSTALKEQP